VNYNLVEPKNMSLNSSSGAWSAWGNSSFHWTLACLDDYYLE